MPKVLLMSHTVPPLSIGVSFLLSRLFAFFPKDSYAVYTTYYMEKSHSGLDGLPCRYYYAPAHSIHKGYNSWSSLREWLEVAPIVWKGLEIIKKEKISAILACPEIGNDILSAYLMHKISNVSLALYFFDCYSEAQTRRFRKYLSGPIERMAINAASTIFVMSEALQKHYQLKYGVRAILLPHPVDSENYLGIATNAKQKEYNHGQKKIIYTGMIYEAHYDSILNLVEAIREIENIEFHIYSRKNIEQLKRIGICGKNVIHHGVVDQKRMAEIQMNADILFMPLAFNSPYPEIIKTASPGKLPEYLASGRPILVHAPSNSYISWYARKYGWALVVDKLEKTKLKEAILRLTTDDVLQRSLISNALATAAFHDSKRVADILQRALHI